MLSMLKTLKPGHRTRDTQPAWLKDTQRELRKPFNRTLSIPGPYIAISRDVPDSQLGYWYRNIHEQLGWSTIQYGPQRQVTYLPGLTSSHVIARHLLLNRKPNQELLNNVSWGTLHKILHQHVTANTDIIHIKNTVTQLYGPQVAQMLDLTDSVSANIAGATCHHTVGETLHLAHKAHPQQLTLLQNLTEGIKANNPHGSLQLEQHTGHNLSCTPDTPKNPPPYITHPTAQAIRESPYWTPCPAKLLETATQMTADATDLLATRLWITTRSPLHDLYQTAENILQRQTPHP